MVRNVSILIIFFFPFLEPLWALRLGSQSMMWSELFNGSGVGKVKWWVNGRLRLGEFGLDTLT